MYPQVESVCQKTLHQRSHLIGGWVFGGFGLNVEARCPRPLITTLDLKPAHVVGIGEQLRQRDALANKSVRRRRSPQRQNQLRCRLDGRDFKRERLLLSRLAVHQRGGGDEEQEQPTAHKNSSTCAGGRRGSADCYARPRASPENPAAA